MNFVNIACGNSFIDSPSWTNYDFTANPHGVMASDLLKKLPLPNDYCDVLYSSHFFEHIPLQYLPRILSEWFRVLKPHGILRVVLPDCEEMFSEYLRLRAARQHTLADFVIAEIIDQSVRSYPGGRLGYFYEQAATCKAHDNSLASFIKLRNGEDLSFFFEHTRSHQLQQNKLPFFLHSFLRIRGKAKQLSTDLQYRFKIFVLNQLFESAFVEQNISFANIGERHHWLWDFYQVSNRLCEAGFSSIARFSHNTSSIADFPFFPLDQLSDGSPRKGTESMFIEAVKLP
jgi:SAM-dependent methyltransferase